MSDIERFHRQEVAALNERIAVLELEVAKWQRIADGNDARYVVMHTHPEGLTLSQLHRDQLFSTGRVLEVREEHLYSVQAHMLKHIPRRPLVAVLWAMSDRYGEAARLGVEVVEVKDFHSAYMVCQDYRAREETKEEEGVILRSVLWERIGA